MTADDWITTNEAAALLCTSTSWFRHRVRQLRHQAHGQGAPLLWYRPDIELAASIRHQCNTGVQPAVRIAAAIRDGRIVAQNCEVDGIG